MFAILVVTSVWRCDATFRKRCSIWIMGFEISFMHTSEGVVHTPEFCCGWSANSRPASPQRGYGYLRLFLVLFLKGAVLLPESRCRRERPLRAWDRMCVARALEVRVSGSLPQVPWCRSV